VHYAQALHHNGHCFSGIASWQYFIYNFDGNLHVLLLVTDDFVLNLENSKLHTGTSIVFQSLFVCLLLISKISTNGAGFQLFLFLPLIFVNHYFSQCNLLNGDYILPKIEIIMKYD